MKEGKKYITILTTSTATPSEDVLHQVQAHGALVERCAVTHSPGSEAIDQETEDREDEHSTRTRWIGRRDEALDGLLDDEDRAH